jgi:hypothetical protein
MRAERDDSPCPAAHERAVVTVRLTLLLVIVGLALFLFIGPGGRPPNGQELGSPAERLK